MPEWACPQPAVHDGRELWAPQGRGVSRTPLWASREVQMVSGEGKAEDGGSPQGPSPGDTEGTGRQRWWGATESGGGGHRQGLTLGR